MFFFLADADPMDDVMPGALFRLWPTHFYFTNHMLMALVAGVLVIAIIKPMFSTASSEPPSGLKNFFESILEFLRIEVFRPALKENTDRFLPFLWTLTLFILFCNVLGQLPIDALITLITGKESHINVTATGSIEATAGLAICVFFCIHGAGLLQIARELMSGAYGHHEAHAEASSAPPHRDQAEGDFEHGHGEQIGSAVPGDFRAVGDPTHHYTDGDSPKAAHGPAAIHTKHTGGMSPLAAWLLAPLIYLWNFAPHAFRPQPGQSSVMWIPDIAMWAILLPLELLGAVIKPFALMMRLFANMIAGHIVLAALIFLIPVSATLATQLAIGAPITILSLMIRFLELFVAFLQTYIFVFLSTMFIASAVAPEH